MTTDRTTENVTRICNAVMKAVVASGVIEDSPSDARVTEAVEVIRDEIKALFTAERYADVRDAVMGTNINEGYVIALVALNCTNRLTPEVA